MTKFALALGVVLLSQSVLAGQLLIAKQSISVLADTDKTLIASSASNGGKTAVECFLHHDPRPILREIKKGAEFDLDLSIDQTQILPPLTLEQAIQWTEETLNISLPKGIKSKEELIRIVSEQHGHNAQVKDPFHFWRFGRTTKMSSFRNGRLFQTYEVSCRSNDPISRSDILNALYTSGFFDVVRDM